VLIDITKNAQNELFEFAEYKKCYEAFEPIGLSLLYRLAEVEAAAESNQSGKEAVHIWRVREFYFPMHQKSCLLFQKKPEYRLLARYLGLGAFPYGSSKLCRLFGDAWKLCP
jgi:hypothetical protein